MPELSDHTKKIWNDLRSRSVYLACSGGGDSMVLLHLLSTLEVKLHVIHVNYQLRGSASNADADLVKSICLQKSIPCDIRTIDLKSKLSKSGNLQDEARKVRYSWFQEILEKDENNRIVLAHHADDQIETFFQNLARKSGVMGLSCMKHEHTGIIRPLLDFSKAEITYYAQKNGLIWREDQSNATNNYSRNRLRNEYLPFVKTEIPDIGKSVLALIDHFQRKQIELEKAVESSLKSIRNENKILVNDYNSHSDLEKIELFRRLKIPVSFVKRIPELSKRGKQLALDHSEYTAVVRDTTHFTFVRCVNTIFQLNIDEVLELPTHFDKDVAYFDASKIVGQLQLRHWQDADRIASVGMNGTQLISDIIKDAKIDANAKAQQLVVHDDESILWCVGLKISRKATPSNQSTHLIRCSISASAEEE